MQSRLRFRMLWVWLLLGATSLFGKVFTFPPAWAAPVAAPLNQTVPPFDVDLYLPQLAALPIRLVGDGLGYDHAPSWSPDGTQIAILRLLGDNVELRRINADGSHSENLSGDQPMTYWGGGAIWSPDGSQIAYVVNGPDFTHLLVMNADGSQKRAVVAKPNLGNIGWAPNGSRIVLETNGEIWVVDPDGSNLKMLLGGEIAHTGPIWSPDSTHIAYYQSSDTAISIMNVDGSEVKRLEIGSELDWGYSRSRWSPNGAMIAFIYQTAPDRGAGGIEIGVVNVDTGALTRVTDHFAEEHDLAWSPDSSKVAFARSGDIHVVNADGSGHLILTQGFGIESLPAWSPDGSKIAFISDKDNGHEVYRIGAGGGTPTRLTFDNDQEQSVSWSPNGNYLLVGAYISYYDDLRVVGASGGDSTSLYPKMHVGSYAWSPVGSQIAFTDVETPESTELYKVDSDGSRLVKLSAELSVDNFAWSPAGQQLAFTVRQSPESSQLYRVNVDGSNLTKLSAGLPVVHYAWSPDGGKIDFLALNNSRTADLYVVEASGEHLTKLMTVDYANSPLPEPMWSPDSNRIAILNGDIFVVDANGGNPINLTSVVGSRSNPAWSPDGELVAFFGSNCSFNCYSDLYVVDPDVGTPLLITNDMAEDANSLTWSPDSTKIAYISVQIETQCFIIHGGCILVPVETYRASLVAVNGSAHKVLANNSIAPTWSPDSRYLLFYGDSGSLTLMDGDGNNHVVPGVPIGTQYGSWAPDGQRILFHSSGFYVVRLPKLP